MMAQAYNPEARALACSSHVPVCLWLATKNGGELCMQQGQDGRGRKWIPAPRRTDLDRHPPAPGRGKVRSVRGSVWNGTTAAAHCLKETRHMAPLSGNVDRFQVSKCHKESSIHQRRAGYHHH